MEITNIESFISYFESIRRRTMNVIACIPKEKILWSPNEEKFSFLEIIKHIAYAERYIFIENAVNNLRLYPGLQNDSIKSYEDVMSLLTNFHEESINLLRTIKDKDLQRKIITPGGIEISIWKWLRAMIEHEIHHRGHIYSNLSLLKIKTPPIFGLEEHQVIANNQK